MVSEFSVSYLMMSLGSRKHVAIWKHVPLTFLQRLPLMSPRNPPSRNSKKKNAIASLPLANEAAVVETAIGEGDVGHIFAKNRNSHR